MNSLLVLFAAVFTASKGMIYNDQPVVTNVTFDGLATTAEVAAVTAAMELKRGVIDRVWDYPELPTAENKIPFVVNGVEWSRDSSGYYYAGRDSDNYIYVHSISGDEAQCELYNERNPDGQRSTYFTIGRYKMATTGTTVVNKVGNEYNVRFGYPDTLALKSDVDALAVTNIARAVVNSVWDDKLGVAWEARMHNGALYYIAVTNRQEVAE